MAFVDHVGEQIVCWVFACVMAGFAALARPSLQIGPVVANTTSRKATAPKVLGDWSEPPEANRTTHL
jgi:hypothetical protein